MSAPPELSPRPTRLPGLMVLRLVCVTAAGYWRVATFDFVNLDDPAYVPNTPQVYHGIS